MMHIGLELVDLILLSFSSSQSLVGDSKNMSSIVLLFLESERGEFFAFANKMLRITFSHWRFFA